MTLYSQNYSFLKIASSLAVTDMHENWCPRNDNALIGFRIIYSKAYYYSYFYKYIRAEVQFRRKISPSVLTISSIS